MLDHLSLLPGLPYWKFSIFNLKSYQETDTLRCTALPSEFFAQLIITWSNQQLHGDMLAEWLSFFSSYVDHAISIYPHDEHFSNLSTHSVGAPSSSLLWGWRNQYLHMHCWDLAFWGMIEFSIARTWHLARFLSFCINFTWSLFFPFLCFCLLSLS